MSTQDLPLRLFAEARQSYQQGDLARAGELCHRALTLRKGQADALNLLGAIAHREGRLDAAIDWLRQAVQANPTNPHCYNNLGVYWTHAEHLNEAVDCYRQALRLRPDFAEAYNNLTYALYSLGRMEEARQCGEKALRLRPNFPHANNHLGLALLELGRPVEAAEQFQKALRLEPQLAAVHRNLGSALRELSRTKEAVACYEQALRLQPGFAEVHQDLADVLREQGHFDDALVQLRQALQLKPDYALVYWNLSEFAGQGIGRLGEDDLARIHALLESNRLSLQDQSVLHLALGNVLDRRGEFDQAFAHYRQGSELRRQWIHQTGKAFDPAAHRVQVERLLVTFDEEFFRQKRPSGSDSELPVFVVGMPRSGTTLVEQILSSHSKAAGAGELWDITKLVAMLGQKGSKRSGYPDCILSVKGSDLRSLAKSYLDRLAKVGGPAIRVVDKMPQNFLHLGVIALAFPRARVIHCRRNPLDVCLSCYFQNFSQVNFAWSLEDLGHYYNDYERLMAHWHKVLPLDILDVGYEDLVVRQEAVSRELIAFCGLEWEDGCLAFHKNRRSVHTASAVQVRRPMYTGSIDRWRKYAAHLEPLRRILGQASTPASGPGRPGNLPLPAKETPGKNSAPEAPLANPHLKQ